MRERWRTVVDGRLKTGARYGVAALCLAAAPVLAAQVGRQTPQTPVPGTAPGGPTQPAQPAQPLVTPGPAAPTVSPRTFTGTAGLIFNTVRPERVTDFELLLAEVQQALARSTNPTTQAQAKGWRFFKAAEPGPNGTVIFVFVIDPVVAGEDYSLGKILVDAFPDAAKVQEVWKLYTSSVTGGGNLMNLGKVSATPLARGRGASPGGAAAPAGTTGATTAAPQDQPATPAPGPPDVTRTPPPDADPARDPAR